MSYIDQSIQKYLFSDWKATDMLIVPGWAGCSVHCIYGNITKQCKKTNNKHKKNSRSNGKNLQHWLHALHVIVRRFLTRLLGILRLPVKHPHVRELSQTHWVVYFYTTRYFSILPYLEGWLCYPNDMAIFFPLVGLRRPVFERVHRIIMDYPRNVWKRQKWTLRQSSDDTVGLLRTGNRVIFFSKSLSL